MANNPNAKDNLVPFTGADDPRRMNGKPKGTKHISTWIQEMIEDENFETQLIQGNKYIEYKGAPMKAIIGTALFKASQGDPAAREWLAKYGYGSKLDITSGGDPVKILLDKFGITEEVENDRKTDGSVPGSSTSSS